MVQSFWKCFKISNFTLICTQKAHVPLFWKSRLTLSVPYVYVINKFHFNSKFFRMHIKIFNFSYYNSALSPTRSKLATFFELHIQGIIAKLTRYGNFAHFFKSIMNYTFVGQNKPYAHWFTSATKLSSKNAFSLK